MVLVALIIGSARGVSIFAYSRLILNLAVHNGPAAGLSFDTCPRQEVPANRGGKTVLVQGYREGGEKGQTGVVIGPLGRQ